MIAGRAWIPRLGLALITVVATLLLGRVWCGWICPLGTVLEWIRFPRARRVPSFSQGSSLPVPSSRWRTVKYVLLTLIVAAALFGNLTLLVLDPIAILTRTATTVVLPALNFAITGAEKALYAVPAARPAVDLVERLLRGPVLPLTQFYFTGSVAIALLFAGVVALNAISDRFWCRYLCPLGGMLALLSKVAVFRRMVGDECNRCAQCAGACPMDTIEPERGYESDPGECTVCLDCFADCPRSGIRYQPHLGGVWREYDPSRRQALLSIGASAAGVALVNTTAQNGAPDPHLIRPPGTLDEFYAEGEFLSKCIRCGACIKVCPTAGLQPSGLDEVGLKGLWTPRLVPRLGQCDYGCHACGQVCPSGAIQHLDLPIKQLTVIGRAYVDTNRCLPWADNVPCAVCEEMCPVPDKAIILLSGEEGEPIAHGGERGRGRGHGTGAASDVEAPRPYVLSTRCIGCGLCERRCPLNGESAIRVYSPNEPPPPMGYV
jgi:ferredoxin